VAWRKGSSGVEEQGSRTLGHAQEPGKPCRLRREGSRLKDEAPEEQKPGPEGAVLSHPRERRDGHATVPRNEGNEVRREGREGLGASS
jgi:hypothetical protein